MPAIIQVGHNAALRLIMIPSLLDRPAKRKHSSFSESSDSGLAPVKKSRRRTKKSRAKSDATRVRIKIRLLQPQTPTAVDDNSDDGNEPDDEDEDEDESRSLTEEKEEDEHSHREDSSPESSDESEDGYIPPRKRQRRCLAATSNRPSSRAHSSASNFAAKHDKGVQTL